MDWRSAPEWEKSAARPQGRAALKTVEGPPAPPPLKGEKMDVIPKILKKPNLFPRRRTLGRAMRRKARRLALAEAPILFFSVVLCWHNVKMCECLLATASFQCIGGGSVPPPMACRTLGRAMRRKARRLALAVEPSLYLSFVLCLQNVKFCACLLAMPSFQCIGGGSVPPPMACRTLGRAARRKARRLALADAPSIYFSFVLCSQNVKSVHVCLQCPVFNASGAAACRPQWLAGRWAGRRAQWRLAWPRRTRRAFIFLSYCVRKT